MVVLLLADILPDIHITLQFQNSASSILFLLESHNLSWRLLIKELAMDDLIPIVEQKLAKPKKAEG